MHKRHNPNNLFSRDELGGELELIELAARLYPDSAYLQTQWLRAVTVVRATARGWLLDMPVVRVRS